MSSRSVRGSVSKITVDGFCDTQNWPLPSISMCTSTLKYLKMLICQYTSLYSSPNTHIHRAHSFLTNENLSWKCDASLRVIGQGNPRSPPKQTKQLSFLFVFHPNWIWRPNFWEVPYLLWLQEVEKAVWNWPRSCYSTCTSYTVGGRRELWVNCVVDVTTGMQRKPVPQLKGSRQCLPPVRPRGVAKPSSGRSVDSACTIALFPVWCLHPKGSSPTETSMEISCTQ